MCKYIMNRNVSQKKTDDTTCQYFIIHELYKV
jgi:hypothetical protein